MYCSTAFLTNLEKGAIGQIPIWKTWRMTKEYTTVLKQTKVKLCSWTFIVSKLTMRDNINYNNKKVQPQKRNCIRSIRTQWARTWSLNRTCSLLWINLLLILSPPHRLLLTVRSNRLRQPWPCWHPSACSRTWRWWCPPGPWFRLSQHSPVHNSTIRHTLLAE